MTTFVDPVYSPHTIKKAYQVEFHLIRNEDYWYTYRSNFILNPHMRHKDSGQPSTTHLHNEMDQPI